MNNDLRLRISDAACHAEEFRAGSYSQFVQGLNEALNKYRAWHTDWAGGAARWQTYLRREYQVPRPYLHIHIRGAWIDVGYGHGTYIMPKLTITENRPGLRHMWSLCVESAGNAEYFHHFINGMAQWISAESPASQRKLTVVKGGNSPPRPG